MVTIVFLLLVLQTLALAAAAEPDTLDKTSFEQTLATEQPVFVKFFAPWCGHCKRLAPTWQELAEKYGNTEVTVARVDCTVETALCAEQGIRGYPTLKLFLGKREEKYEGKRDLEHLVEFVHKHTSVESQDAASEVDADVADVMTGEDGVVHLTEENFKSYIRDSKGSHFVKFYAPWCGHCKRLSPTWSELASHFKDDPLVHVIKVDCTENQQLCRGYHVSGYPTLLLFQDGIVVEKYSGARDLQELITFITDNYLEAEEIGEAKGPVDLTKESFPREIAQGMTFVKFYAPWCGHCKRLAPTWEELAETLHSSGTVTVARVDCTVERDLCSEFGVKGFPTLVLFKEGERLAPYTGSRDLQSLLKFAKQNSS